MSYATALSEGISSAFPTLGGYLFFLMLIGLVITALYSYKLFKLEMTVSALIFGFWFGALYLPSILGIDVTEFQSFVYLPNLFGILCAFGLAALIHLIFKLAIFVAGALFGVGVALFTLPRMDGPEFLHTNLGFWLTVAVIAIICGIIMLFIFKPLYIVLTSVVSGVLSGAVLNIILIPQSEALSTVILSLGVALAVFGIIFQFKTNPPTRAKKKKKARREAEVPA